MTISVLMSVYKAENPGFLDRALQSIYDDQTFKPMQIVLVEDGPLGDNLEAVVIRWKDRLGEMLTILKNEVNLGLTKSLNKGICVAKGDLIARMDSDDISAPQRFELQSKYLEEHTDIDIVGGSLREFDELHSELRIRHYPLVHEEVMKYMCKACPLAHPTVMIRRKIFDAGLRYDERYKMSQDIALWYDVVLAGYKIANVPEVTINFRSDGNVFKRRSRVKAWNEFKIYMVGIYKMYGFLSMKYRYPIARLCFRLMPPSIVKKVYSSRMRSRLLEVKD